MGTVHNRHGLWFGWWDHSLGRRSEVVGRAVVGVLDLDPQRLEVVSEGVGTLVIARRALLFAHVEDEFDQFAGQRRRPLRGPLEVEPEHALADVLKGLDRLTEAAIVVNVGEDVLGFDFEGATEGTATLAGELVELVLDVREEERSAGNYERADALRDDLEALGVEVQDTDDGPTYDL